MKHTLMELMFLWSFFLDLVGFVCSALAAELVSLGRRYWQWGCLFARDWGACSAALQAHFCLVSSQPFAFQSPGCLSAVQYRDWMSRLRLTRIWSCVCNNGEIRWATLSFILNQIVYSVLEKNLHLVFWSHNYFL